MKENKMSISKIKMMTCKECKRNFFVKVYDLIDGDKDYDLRKKFIFDELFIFKCPYCGHIHFVPYPLKYINQKKHFIVQFGSLSDVYNFYYNDKDIDTSLYIKTGATTTILAREKVVALENNLDHRIASIYRYIMAKQYEEYAKENNLPKLEDSYLCYDDDGNLAVIFDVIEDGKPNSFCQLFDQELYEEIKNDYIDCLNNTNDMIFDDKSVMKVLCANKLKRQSN